MTAEPEEEDPELRRQRIGHYWLATIRAQLTGKNVEKIETSPDDTDPDPF